jgi:hypothetical protein
MKIQANSSSLSTGTICTISIVPFDKHFEVKTGSSSQPLVPASFRAGSHEGLLTDPLEVNVGYRYSWECLACWIYYAADQVVVRHDFVVGIMMFDGFQVVMGRLHENDY